MAKFLIMFNSTESAKELMAHASPEEMQASMADWIAWKEEADKTVSFEFGLPLQIIGHVTPDAVSEGSSPAGGYAMIEAGDKDTVLTLLQTHPQLKRPGASVDVFEMQSMPGL